MATEVNSHRDWFIRWAWFDLYEAIFVWTAAVYIQHFWQDTKGNLNFEFKFVLHFILQVAFDRDCRNLAVAAGNGKLGAEEEVHPMDGGEPRPHPHHYRTPGILHLWHHLEGEHALIFLTSVALCHQMEWRMTMCVILDFKEIFHVQSLYHNWI